jgi:hypothetical protein
MQCAEKLYDLLYIEDLTKAEEILETVQEGPERETVLSKIADLEAACDTLLETKWSTPVNEVREHRDRLYGLLRVEKPAVTVGASSQVVGMRRKVETRLRDEHETYGALVDDAGY